MSFNVSQFISGIGSRGIVQDNKYDIQITFSNTSTQAASLSTQNETTTMSAMCADLSFRCVSAGTPSFSIRTANINRYGLGVMEEMPFASLFGNLPLSFLCDAKGGVYSFWYSWLNLVISSTGQSSGTLSNQLTANTQYYTTEYKTNYSATITITTYDNAGNVAVVHNYYQAYPLAVSEEKLSWDSTDKLLMISPTISFKDWQVNNAIISSSSTS